MVVLLLLNKKLNLLKEWVCKMIRIKRLKKKLKKLTPFIVICMLCAVVVIKSVSLFFGMCQQRIHILCQPESIECKYSHIYSKKITSSLEEFICKYAESRSIISFNPNELFEKIKKQFTCVKSCDYKVLAPSKIVITLHGRLPKLLVNDVLVLTESYQLLSASDFENFDKQTLPRVTIAPAWCHKKIDHHLYNFFSHVSSEIAQTYELSFYGPHEIVMTPFSSAYPLKIIADNTSFFKGEKLNQVATIFADLLKKEKITQRMVTYKLGHVVFDIRFDDRVYVKFHSKARQGGNV